MRADQKIGACDADNLFIDGKFPLTPWASQSRAEKEFSRAAQSLQ